MTTIYSQDDQPARHVHVRAMISLLPHEDLGHAIRCAKENMARDLARLIIEDDKQVFWQRSGRTVGFSTLEYGADVFVLTPEELRQIKQDSFTKGLRHAYGFMPIDERNRKG